MALTIGSFLFFTGLVAVLTWWLTRRDRHDTSDGYFLGGRSLTGGYIAGSLMLTNLSTEQLVGLNGGAFTDGLCVMAWEVIAGASLVLMALAILPRYLKSGITTVPQFLEERFDGTTRAITSIIFLLAYAGILLPILLFTGATGLITVLNLEGMTGWDRVPLLWAVVSTIGVIGATYAIVGGLRSVAVSDTLNGFGLLSGGLLITYLGLKAVDPAGPMAALEGLAERHPEKFNSIGGEATSVPFGTLFTGVLLLNLFYWTTNQQIIQRTFAASSLKEGQKGVLFAGFLKILAPLILVLPGIIAFDLFAAEDVAANDAYGTLVQNVLPVGLVGFFAAVLLGAILSSFNSALNSTATIFSLGVYRDMVNPAATDNQVIRAGKIFGWIIAAVSVCIAPLLNGQDAIFDYLQKMNGLYFIPILSVMVVGLYTRNVPAAAANVALLVGCAALLTCYFVPPVQKAVDASVHGFHLLGIVFAGLVILQLVWGLAAPRETPFVQRDAKAIDMTPWKPAWAVGIGLMVVVLGVYAYFADFSVLTSDAAAAEQTEAVEQVETPAQTEEPEEVGGADIAAPVDPEI